MLFHTKKLYYSDVFLSECEAEIMDIRNGNELCLSQTVAYPEGGGQISDIGMFQFDTLQIRFDNVKKGYGRVLSVPDFPTVNVDTPVYHTVDSTFANYFFVGQKIRQQIDVKHRMWTTLHHSAIHLALMAASEIRGDLYHCIKGCNITTEHARLDFSIDQRLSETEMETINGKVNDLIMESVPIIVYPYPGEDEAWFWKCKDYVCPCGGTHVTNTSQIGHVIIKRKSVGKGSERIIVTVNDPNLTTELYH